jgi:hypothetical protein
MVAAVAAVLRTSISACALFVRNILRPTNLRQIIAIERHTRNPTTTSASTASGGRRAARTDKYGDPITILN